MRVIGLTGGIASGKSTVSKMLAELGAVVLDADRIAHDVVSPSAPAWADIVAAFGRDVLKSDNTIDRQRLGSLVFADATARLHLEGIVHPQVKAVLLAQLQEQRARGAHTVVLDIPLLYEVGWQCLSSEVWVVFVDRHIQLERLMQRNGLTSQEAAGRIAAQMVLAEKAKLADIVIDNNGHLEDTRRQVVYHWQQQRRKAQNK